MNMIDKVLGDAGLLEVLEARRRGQDIAAFEARLDATDLILLGALAERVRQEEVGDRVYLSFANAQARADASDASVLVHPPALDSHQRGLATLRTVAMARLTGPKGSKIAVDWSETGIELAQVALSFGANALRGPVQTKRGLLIADDLTKKVKGEGMVAVAKLKERELAEMIRRAGREPVFQGASAHEPEHADRQGEVTT